MKKLLPLLAIVGAIVGVVGALVLTGDSIPGPDATASKWANAIATHDFQTACSYETAAYSGGADCAKGYEQGIAATNAAAGRDVVKGLEHTGTCAVVQVPEQPTVAYCFLTGPNLDGQVPILVLEQAKNGSWHVAFLS